MMAGIVNLAQRKRMDTVTPVQPWGGGAPVTLGPCQTLSVKNTIQPRKSRCGRRHSRRR